MGISYSYIDSRCFFFIFFFNFHSQSKLIKIIMHGEMCAHQQLRGKRARQWTNWAWVRYTLKKIKSRIASFFTLIYCRFSNQIRSSSLNYIWYYIDFFLSVYGLKQKQKFPYTFHSIFFSISSSLFFPLTFI